MVTGLVIWLTIGLLTLLVGMFLVDRVRSATGEEACAFARLHGVVETPEGTELCRRYLSRARRFRFVFSVAGLLAGVVLERGGISLLTIVPGWFVGVIATELFRLRRPGRAGGVRTASLAPRSPQRYVRPWLAWHPRVAALATMVLAATALALPWHGSPEILCALGGTALGVLVLAESCQRAIAARVRPALPPTLEHTDDAIRRIGAEAVGYAASGGLTAVFGISCLTAFRMATRPVLVHTVGGWQLLPGQASPPYLDGTFAVLGLAMLVWAVSLGITEHRFFWPKLPRNVGWRWRRGVAS
jgi:hypothetical protein